MNGMAYALLAVIILVALAEVEASGWLGSVIRSFG